MNGHSLTLSRFGASRPAGRHRTPIGTLPSPDAAIPPRTDIPCPKFDSTSTIMKVKTFTRKMEYGPAPESAAPALDWLAQHNKQFNLFVDGGWHKREVAAFQFHQPVQQKCAGSPLPKAPKRCVDLAVSSLHAKPCQVGWRSVHRLSAGENTGYAPARQIQNERPPFCPCSKSCWINGKPIRETRVLIFPLSAVDIFITMLVGPSCSDGESKEFSGS